MKYEELKRAVDVIKRECSKHTACVKCPLQFVTCMYSTPDDWQPTGLNYESEEGENNGYNMR